MKRNSEWKQCRTINSTQEGFTLIELLIVIAIIGLLSAIVIASLMQAKQKATNTAKTALVKQYQIALESYYNDHGMYPKGENSTYSYCLGSTWDPNYKCLGNRISTIINNDLAPYIPGPPASVSATVYGATGINYKCVNGCSEYSMFWYLDGNASCASGFVYLSDNLTFTNCELDGGN